MDYNPLTKIRFGIILNTMLTNADLLKIGNLIKSRTESIVVKHISSFEKRIIRKINLVISLIENNYLNHEGRITRIEKHIGLN